MKNKVVAYLVSKICAVIFISLCFAGILKIFDAHELAKYENADSDPDSPLAAHYRHMHQHSYLEVFIMSLFFGMIYVGAVELISYVISRLLQKDSIQD